MPRTPAAARSPRILAGCATIPKSEQVQIRAAHDFACDADKVTTTSIDGKTMKASGCAHEATYVEECPPGNSTRCTWVTRDGATPGGVHANVPGPGASE